MSRILSDADLIRLQQHIAATGSPVGFAPTPKKKRRNEESLAQQAVIKWWDYSHKSFGLPKWALFAIPNGSARNEFTGVVLKREGVRAGIPDLFLAVPRGNRSGMFIEMKTAVGKLSEEQAAIIPVLETLGYSTVICRGSSEAIKFIQAYLGARA